MLIVTVRTDKPEAEVGLYDGQTQLAYKVWHAHRELSTTLHTAIRTLLTGIGKDWRDIQGVVCFKGPGSFTGLRIGLTVANALAYSLDIPIVAEKDAWIEQGIARIQAGQTDTLVVPEYGAPAHITQPRK